MGSNTFIADTTVHKSLYSEQVWREKLPTIFWSRFFNFPMPGDAGFSKDQYIVDDKSGAIVGYGNKEDSLIRIVRDLQSGLGDNVTFPHVKGLRGKGITGSSGQTLKGNEEEMSVGNFKITLEEYCHAVSDKSPLGRKRTQFQVVPEMGNQIMSWGATRTDDLIWDGLYAGTPTTILYPDGVSATTGIIDDPSNRMSMKLLRQAKAIAQTEKIGSRYIIEPIMINGKAHYVVVLPPDAVLDLKEDSEFKQSLQSAGERGESNPIFAGADYITIDGLVIYSHQKALTSTTWGSGANIVGARSKLLGKSAICYAMGQAPKIVEEKEDFGRKISVSFQMMMAASRPSFGSIDYGSLEIRTNCSRVTF